MRRCRTFVVVTMVVVVVVLVVLSVPVAGARPRSAAPRPDPVLLVHGFRGSSTGWQPLISSLQRHGYRAAEIDAIDYGNDASNVDVARQLAREASALRARTGAKRIDVVSHSMGAISSRYFLERLGGDQHVDAWVSLAGVNRGTIWAYGCYVLIPCREMAPNSTVLELLNRESAAHTLTRYGAWWSPCDEAIIPRANAELVGAHNVETTCLDHTALRTDPHVLAQVIDFLRQRVHES